MKNLIIFGMLLISQSAISGVPKIQNEGIKSEAELIAAGSNASHLPNDDKVWVKALTINKTLNTAITDGTILTTGADTYPSIESIKNHAVASSVGASALTVALKNKAGNDPSGADPVLISFRHSTADNGTFTVRTVNSSLSVVAPSGATLGFTNAIQGTVWVYALDNSGTVELAVSGGMLFDEGSVQSTTAISAASDSQTVLYSTIARSNVPIRLIGRLFATEATAGTWATSPSEVATKPKRSAPVSWSGFHASNCSWPRTSTVYGDPTADATCTFTQNTSSSFPTVTSYNSAGSNLPGIVFTPLELGVYWVCSTFVVREDSSTGISNHELSDTSGTPFVIGESTHRDAGGTNDFDTETLCGPYPITSLSAVTLRIRTKMGGGGQIVTLSNSGANREVTWSVFKMP